MRATRAAARVSATAPPAPRSVGCLLPMSVVQRANGYRRGRESCCEGKSIADALCILQGQFESPLLFGRQEVWFYADPPKRANKALAFLINCIEHVTRATSYAFKDASDAQTKVRDIGRSVPELRAAVLAKDERVTSVAVALAYGLRSLADEKRCKDCSNEWKEHTEGLNGRTRSGEYRASRYRDDPGACGVVPRALGMRGKIVAGPYLCCGPFGFLERRIYELLGTENNILSVDHGGGGFNVREWDVNALVKQKGQPTSPQRREFLQELSAKTEPVLNAELGMGAFVFFATPSCTESFIAEGSRTNILPSLAKNVARWLAEDGVRRFERHIKLGRPIDAAFVDDMDKAIWKSVATSKRIVGLYESCLALAQDHEVLRTFGRERAGAGHGPTVIIEVSRRMFKILECRGLVPLGTEGSDPGTLHLRRVNIGNRVLLVSATMLPTLDLLPRGTTRPKGRARSKARKLVADAAPSRSMVTDGPAAACLEVPIYDAVLIAVLLDAKISAKLAEWAAAKLVPQKGPGKPRKSNPGIAKFAETTVSRQPRLQS